MIATTSTQWVTLLGLLSATVRGAYQPLVPVESRSIDEIYAAAKQESGALQVFWGGDAGSQGAAVRTAWKQQFPDIALNLTVDLSKYHDNRIDRAQLQGLHVADIAVLQTLQDFPRWKAEGKLLSYKPPTFEELLNGEKDHDGAYLPIGINTFGNFVYDTSKLDSSDVPTSYASIPDAKYRSKLILTYPNDDDAVAYLFSLIVSRYGYQWLYDLAQNDVQWVRGTGTPGLQLAALHNTTSSRALSFTSYTQGAAYNTVAPEAPEQQMSWAQSGAIIASTPRPETAKLFISWLTSYAHQNASSSATSATVLTSLNDARGVSPYASNTSQISGFRVFEQDRQRVEWWKNLFEEVLGTPQGKGPLEVYPNPPS